MMILTKAIKEKLIANHKAQDGTKSFKAELKLFNPTGIGTWYLSELNPENNNAFGLCCLTEEEFGYVKFDRPNSVHLQILQSQCVQFDAIMSPVHF